MVFGAGLALLLVVVPAVVLSERGASGPVAAAGVFDFPQPGTATVRPAEPQRLAPIREIPQVEAHEIAEPPPPALDSITEQVRNASPARALMLIESYRQESRDRSFELHLDELQQEVFDRLWWQRIGELMAQRDAANRQLTTLRVEYGSADDPARRAQIANDLRQLTRQVESATSDLQSMNYQGVAAPDPSNHVQLGMLRQQRDPAQYQRWQQSVLRSLAQTGGRLPWEAGR